MSSDKILEIASVHLGKAGDGSVVKPYQTPDKADPSLLVPTPRELNREKYGIVNDLFTGHDIWNCYETSFLLDNGYPVSGVLIIDYPSDSPNIVESKSLKLYLNSYNMMRIGGDRYTAADYMATQVETDLAKALDLSKICVNATFHINQQCPAYSSTYATQFLTIEDLIDVEDLDFDQYNESVDLLKCVNQSNTVQRLHTAALRSNCRVTNQPDWGDVYIHIAGDKAVDPASLLQYIVSMRQENHFHEEICEMIYLRLNDLLSPKELFVSCNYTRRGGIDINPARASSPEVLFRIANINGPFMKTMRQ